jgi:hypothetical protein
MKRNETIADESSIELSKDGATAGAAGPRVRRARDRPTAADENTCLTVLSPK